MRISDINLEVLNKVMTEKQHEKIKNLKNINLCDILDNIKIIFRMNDFKENFIIDEKLIDMVIDLLEGYQEWLYELDTSIECSIEDQLYCNEEKMGCTGCYYKKGE